MTLSTIASPLERDGRRVQPFLRNRNEVEVTAGGTEGSRDSGSEQTKSHYERVLSGECLDRFLGLHRNSNAMHIGIKYLNNPHENDCN
jgi:hypothetical protein